LYEMTRPFTFGIVGGYGAAGSAVASQLRRWCDANVLIAGRDLAKATALATTFDHGVSAARVDVLDERSLSEFCGRCAIVVNCAGPVAVLQDRVAQAAFRQRCHYVDAAGMAVVRERLASRSQEIEHLGLSFVVSAGWMPGLSEVVATYAHAWAKAKLDVIDSLRVYFGDSGEWSENALRDGAAYMKSTGLQRAHYFKKGEPTRAKMSGAVQRVDLGAPIGRRRFAMFFTPELSDIGRSLVDCDVYAFTYLSGLRSAIVAPVLALVPLPERWRVGMLRNVFRRNRLPADGFVAAHVHGKSQGAARTLSVQVVYRERRDYWIHGVVLAAVARMLSNGGGVRPGVHLLAHAVDPVVFMEELRKDGVEATERD
jgi:saccharopine dehydrogenase (NAD+, L-lysine forming)